MKHALPVLYVVFLAVAAHATDRVNGRVSSFQSYNEIGERCVQISPIPGGEFDEEDIEDEIALCDIDFYSDEIALCPKIWSTSAAVVIYDISEGKFAKERLAFQQKVCEGGKVAKYVAYDKLARLKFTMNQETTSAVFTPSSLLYYHFSRYFGFETNVPVAVWRSIDKSVLLNEVALGGVSLSDNNQVLAANNAAWRTLVATIDDPENYEQPGSYGSAADLVTADGQRLFGVMYDGGGDPYGPEINGISDDAMHLVERYQSFLNTPTIVALSTDAALLQSIETGFTEGSAALAAAGLENSDISALQMAFWMREISEILLIDFIMGQQDRITNFDFRKYYYWLENGKVKRKRARALKPGEKGIPLDAILISRTKLNDNDAGGLPEYDNHTMQAHFLEQLRHFDAFIYRRLLTLDADFQSKGPIYAWLNASLGLEQDQVEMIVANTSLAAGILRSNCTKGALRFDLNVKRFFETGQDLSEEQACNGG